MFETKETGVISILSSDHDRLHRQERDISERDLQKAYGTRASTWGNRWKIEHENTIYITDRALTTEITCYNSPYDFQPDEERDQKPTKTQSSSFSACLKNATRIPSWSWTTVDP